jgi:hypothetical protein
MYYKFVKIWVCSFFSLKADQGLFERWGGEFLPALFAVNPKTEQVILLAYGLTAIDQIETRLMTLVRNRTYD